MGRYIGDVQTEVVLEEQSRMFNFPIHSWNVYTQEDPRTNNSTEGWHSKMKKLAGKSPKHLRGSHPFQV